jgi:hypothetical protein
LCPNCRFPYGFSGKNLDGRIESLIREIENIYEDWENSLLAEVNNYRDNLDYLAAGEKSRILQLIKAGKLPEVISEEPVIALNNLFKELVSIEVSPQELLEVLFAGAQVMDYFTFERKLDEWKQKLVAGYDLDKVRIKLAGSNGGNNGQTF